MSFYSKDIVKQSFDTQIGKIWYLFLVDNHFYINTPNKNLYIVTTKMIKYTRKYRVGISVISVVHIESYFTFSIIKYFWSVGPEKERLDWAGLLYIYIHPKA